MTTTRDDRLASLQTAIDRAGGLMAFCAQMGVSHQAIGAWRRRGYVPPQRALEIENRFGVRRVELVHESIAEVLSAPVSDVAGVV